MNNNYLNDPDLKDMLNLSNKKPDQKSKNFLPSEIKNILIDIKNKKSFDDIAGIYNRSPEKIQLKLLDIAYQLNYIYDIDINILSIKINLPHDIIQNYINSKINNNQNNVTSDSSCEKKAESINSSSFDMSCSNMQNILSQKESEAKLLVVLNENQQKAFDHFKNNKNVFITGPAGTGKSVVIKEIIKYCIDNNIHFGTTATTGNAALLIGGRTIHSYLGIGLAEKSAKELYNHNRYHLSHTVKKLRDLEVLIIDEISMLDLELFNKISEYLSLIKFNKKPFGGIKLILTGDFCQLEPVNGDFCFLSDIWNQIDLEIIFLTKMVRQENDKVFQKILRELRYGICTDKTCDILKKCTNLNIDEDIKPSILHSKNIDVDRINKIEYTKLLSQNKKSKTYEIELPKLKKNHEKIKNWIKSLDIPFTVDLCIDAQIIVTANIDQEKGIVNGTRGVIVDLLSDKIIIKTINSNLINISYHKRNYAEDNDLYFNYMPIKLAYALSIHKSQGTTLDAVEISIGKDIFASGQAYTALSRARNLSNVIIKDICKTSFIIKDSVLKFYSKIDPKLSF
jgi:ATP-dependent DNA helicase PIF1